ncbi:DNA damage-inducible transcript 3 protein [Carcharodon carcharias]|uniref:DNA damage-inducible transcript 3 protein n=1 Tax=Carcharodon carcharias TaxID=13397 RepID=UPI001B7E5447|nr:DNA damage-inducible transcript 3 protein [Carcharodon carcharias]XP_041036493.1 DNA damage-inducible transcript 3 protein [Carcharodon carcharias]XP_041036494.1 DNA damage-inducible transcript 3 protein [Carcharodon carcharias]
MAGFTPAGHFPSTPALLSGQELEAWLEDLDSVLYPTPLRNPPEDSPKLKQLWLEDIDSVLYPTPPRNPSEGAHRLGQLLLDDLESILYPTPVGNPSEDGGRIGQAPQYTQLGSGLPGRCDRPLDSRPLQDEGTAREGRSTVDLGRDLSDAPSARGDRSGGCSEREPPSLNPPSSSSGSSSSSSESNSGPRGPASCQGRRRGTKRRRAGSCACSGERRRGGEQEGQVARLTEENERLRRRIEELTAEVQVARRRLIEKMVNAR